MENKQERITSGFPEEMREKINDLWKRLETLYAKKNPEIIKEIVDFTWKLRSRNGKSFLDYATYYVLERENPDKLWPSAFSPKKFDFPGEDSVEKFIERLEEKYK